MDPFEDLPSFYERHDNLKVLPNANQIKSEVFLAAQKTYASVLNDLRSWIENPDNETHELGKTCFALQWVVRQELQKMGCKCYELGISVSPRESRFSVTYEEVYVITIFSETYVADVVEDLSKHSRETMLQKLEISIKLDHELVKEEFPDLDALYPWIKKLLAERGLQITQKVSTLLFVGYDYTVSCDAESTPTEGQLVK